MKRAALLVCALLAGAAMAQSLTSPRLTVGMSATLSGPDGGRAQELARGLGLGLAQANAGGGIGGRRVELLLRDDAGDSGRALENTQQLIDAGVLALTSANSVPEPALALMAQANVPLVGVASGAEALREPSRTLVFNLRAGWLDEAGAMVLHLDSIGVTDIATLSQDDALGRAGRDGMRAELARLALRPVAQAVLGLPADDAAVSWAVDGVCRSRPQALVLMLDAVHAPAAVQQARRTGCTRWIYLANEAGSRLDPSPAATAGTAGVVVAQVVPHPANLAIPVVAEFNRAAKAAGIQPGYAGLEGYVYARVLVEALARCAREPSRRCLAAALEARPIDVGGHRVKFSPTDRRGSRFVELTLFLPDGRFRR